MAQESKTQIKTYFENGDFPDQDQFGNFCDSVPFFIDSYTGHANKVLAVKADETGLEFTTPAGGVSDGDKGDVVVTSGVWLLEDQLKKSYSLNMYAALGGSILAEPLYSAEKAIVNSSLFDGNVRGVAVWLPKDATLTGVKWFQSTQGDYVADNYNGIGLYSYAGGTMTLVASTTNDGNIWKAAGTAWASKAFSSTYAAAAGLYFVAVVYNNSAQTTGPQIAAGANGNSNLVGVDFTNSAKISWLISGTTLPSSQAMSGVSGSNQNYYLGLY